MVYPNLYEIGMSNLGFQLVYSLLNEQENLVCERFFLPAGNEPLRSFESHRTVEHFPLLFYSISFEDDYLNLVRILIAGGVEPFAKQRQSELNGSNPLVIGGGVATFLNPEPLALFTDLFVIGEAEAVLDALLVELVKGIGNEPKGRLLSRIGKEIPGIYVPSLYRPHYDDAGTLVSMSSDSCVPERIKKVSVGQCEEAAHSQVLTPNAEFSNLFVTELGRGCSRGCRFCAAGFIYRPPRLWGSDAVIKGLEQRFQDSGRIGLLGMEMADTESLQFLSSYLLNSGCSLSFSSLRADRISGTLLELLGGSGLKSVALAPDGASERLRRVINKGLTEDEILKACQNLAEVGLVKLKLYLMIGLPSEQNEDLDEILLLIRKIKKVMEPAGKARGHLCEILLSVNCHIPKPWTPFQHHCFGISERLAEGEVRPVAESIHVLKKKIKYLRKGITAVPNVRLRCDKPEKMVFQAVLAKGDRRLGGVLYDMAMECSSWKKAMKSNNLTAEQFITTGTGAATFFPWYIIDHGIEPAYLFHEYEKSFSGLTTKPCNPQICRSCGVCREK